MVLFWNWVDRDEGSRTTPMAMAGTLNLGHEFLKAAGWEILDLWRKEYHVSFPIYVAVQDLIRLQEHENNS